MTKKLLNLVILLWVIINAFNCVAETGSEQILQLYTRNGKIIRFALSDNPVTTFSDGMLRVTAGEFSAEYPLTDMIKYTFTSEISGIESIDADSLIKIGFVNNKVSVSGVPVNEEINIYGIDGRIITMVEVTDSITVIDMSGYQNGIYVIKAGNARLKVLKK